MVSTAYVRWALPAAALALLLLPARAGAAGPAVVGPCAAGDTCLAGPLPQNPDNRVVLCSPRPDRVQIRVVEEGAELSWDAPPRSCTSYVSRVEAVRWAGVDSGATVEAVRISGTYAAFKDRRIQLDVQTIEGPGGFVHEGTLGVERVRIFWSSLYDVTRTGAVGGEFIVDASSVDQPRRFEVPPRPGTTLPPDSTVLGGLRLTFRSGFRVREGDAAVFDVEDFEGFHVWRWDADPLAPGFRAIGEYSKLGGFASPARAWPDVTPASRRIRFVDRNVFDGFLYHYAITTYDQGFRRATSGTTLAVKIESPVGAATRGVDGTVVLHPAQIRFEYRKPPPPDFRPITAVPNPFRASVSDGSRESEFVFFTNAPPRGTLFIFTASGDLVLEREHLIPDVGVITWDTRNGAGELVSSGVYIYKIVDLVSGQQSFGRLAIIR